MCRRAALRAGRDGAKSERLGAEGLVPLARRSSGGAGRARGDRRLDDDGGLDRLRHPADDAHAGPPGILRVSIPWRGFDELVDSAFDQIRLYGKADIAVSLRLLRALADIATTIPDPSVRECLAERGRQIVAGCAGELAEEEVRKLRQRLSTLEELRISRESSTAGAARD